MKNPSVCVILAAYNGCCYLEEQIDSILSQQLVDITILVFDDKSQDNTRELVEKYSLKDQRVRLCGWNVAKGGAFQNFRASVLFGDLNQFDYVAFSDQDDVWVPHKTALQIELIRNANAAGCSSSVLAVFENSAQPDRTIDNVGVQKKYDFFFEGGGQGCTYVFPLKSFNVLRAVFLKEQQALESKVLPHDWLLYALCRASGQQWIICAEPLVRYRQHQGNVMGARGGVRSAIHRLKMLRNGGFRQQRLAICRMVAMATPGAVPFTLISEEVGFLARTLFAARQPFAFRRFKFHSVLMAVLFSLGWG